MSLIKFIKFDVVISPISTLLTFKNNVPFQMHRGPNVDLEDVWQSPDRRLLRHNQCRQAGFSRMKTSNNAVCQSMSAIVQYLIQASRRPSPSPGPPNLSCLQVSPPATFSYRHFLIDGIQQFLLSSNLIGTFTHTFIGTKGISTISLDTSISERGTSLIITFLAEQIPLVES